MKKLKAYIFPIKSNKTKLNPYVFLLRDSLSDYFLINNDNGTRNIGLFDLFSNLSCDYFFFNWTENIPKLRLGKLQTILFILYTFLIKLLNKKIVWILHNKIPHDGDNRWSRLIMWHTANVSDIVITHSQDGIEYYVSMYKKMNIVYIPHPAYEDIKPVKTSNRFDIVIWGSIAPYKNIVPFLTYCSKSEFFKSQKIVICGKCNDGEYLSQIDELLTPNITFINEFLKDAVLINYISSSKIILFTYSSDSILSSGALVYSLALLKPIIGPHIGAFKDYEAENLISTYQDFDQIEKIIKEPRFEINNIKEHLRGNTWKSFSRFVFNTLRN